MGSQLEIATKAIIPISERPILVVGHVTPDTDVWLCAWLIRNHYTEATMSIALVPSGNRLEKYAPEWKTHRVFHVDTGGGWFDQKGKELKGSSSFALVAQELGYENDPAVQKLLPMINAVDNAKQIDPTSIHYLVTALQYKFRTGSKTDWNMVQEYAFLVFDTMAEKWRADARTAKKFDAEATVETLPNGMTFCALLNKPGLRHAAFASGVDVVAWIAPVPGGFHPAVQTNSESEKDIDLTGVVVKLREDEAEVRHVRTDGLKLDSFQAVIGLAGWFLHDSLRLILCGSKTHPLEEEELTRLKAARFFTTVRRALGEIELRG